MSHRYTIPAGTSVHVRNLSTGEKEMRKHTTRKPLYFDDRAGTGYNWAVYHFIQQTEAGTFEIRVLASEVE